MGKNETDWKDQYVWIEDNPGVLVTNIKVQKVWVDWMVEQIASPYGVRSLMGLEDFITKRSPQTLMTYYEEWLWKWPKRFKDYE